MDRAPDYSNTYFPPPPGSSTSQSSSSIAYYPPPPPPDRAYPATPNRQGHGPYTPSPYAPRPSLSHEHQHLNAAQQPSPTYAAHQRTYPSPYQPHAEVYQTSPLPSPSLLPPTVQVGRPNSPAFRTRFASVSLHGSDHVRFLRFPPALYSLLRTTIQNTWPRGIQSENVTTSFLDIKLKGNPWSVGIRDLTGVRSALDRDVEHIHAQQLMCALMDVLQREGWILMHSTDLSMAPSNDMLLFRHQRPAPIPHEWFSFAFSSSSSLRLVNAPRALCMSILERFGSQMEVKFRNHSKVEGCCEIKWTLSLVDPMKNSVMFLDLIECLEESGWTLYASVQQFPRGDEKILADTWYCCRPEGWIEGNPVYHN